MKPLEIDEIRHIQLNILASIDEFCDHNKMSYFLTGGTLIGAVRHKGYIPWDDDIDINMPRKDFNQFINEFNKNRNDNLKVIYYTIDNNFPFTFAKVIDSNTLLVENIDSDFSLGVNIDVFPLENLDNDINKVSKLSNKISFYRNLLAIKTVKQSSNRKFYKRFILFLGKKLLYYCSIKYIINKISVLSQRYIDNENSRYVSVLSVFTYGKGEIIERKEYSNYIKLDFEGKKYRAPIGYDKVLRNLYGDYMRLPPKENQVTHHNYKAYKF